MYYILIIIAIVSAITIFSSCTSSLKKPINTTGSTNTVSQGVPGMTELTKEEIKTQLQKLASDPTPAPDELQMGAMCYEIASPPDRAEYICPKCGEKTFYARMKSVKTGERSVNWDIIGDVSWEIAACRRLMDKIKKIHAKLDESQYCSFCSPGTGHPELGLIISYPDTDKPHSVYGITTEDISLIIEFLDGETKHASSNDAQFPLKDFIERLETLLGVSL